VALTLAEREEISRGLAVGRSMRKIAQQLGRAPSTICREVRRNQGWAHYRAGQAEERAWQEARRPKACRLAVTAALRLLVAEKLHADWSPAQIAGWLAQTYPEKPTMRVSHETIYRSLFIQARGVLAKHLIAHLRSKRTMRRGQHATTAEQQRARIHDAVSIRERPAAVTDRAIPGH
jgi:IS30 family transposase